MCDGTDVQIGLRCPDYARRVLDAASLLLDAARTDLLTVSNVYHATSPTDMDAALTAQRYRDAVGNVLLCERTWVAAAAQFAATSDGAVELRELWFAIDKNAQRAWLAGDSQAGRALFEEAALYDYALKRGEVLRFAAQEASRRTGWMAEPHDCSADAVILPDPVADRGLLPLLDILGVTRSRRLEFDVPPAVGSSS